MNSLITILWFVWLLISIQLVYNTVGIHAIVNFLPEGKRWYQVPLQFLSLINFAGAVLVHPFK